MHEQTSYLGWAAGLCALLAVFGTIMLVGGFRDPSVGRVMTVVVLYVATVVLGVLAYRRRPRS